MSTDDQFPFRISVRNLEAIRETNDYMTHEARAEFARRQADIDAELIAAALDRADWDEECGVYGVDEPTDRLARAARAYRIEHAGEGI